MSVVGEYDPRAASQLANANFDELPFEMGENLPPFANEYNKGLDREIKEKERYLSGVEKELEEHSARVAEMRQHLKTYQAEFAQTQLFNSAKQKEVQTERHLRQLAERETGRLKADTDKRKTEVEEVLEKANVAQNSLFKVNHKLDGYKEQFNINQEQLQQWAVAKQQKEEDYLVLEKYSRSDEAKIKELNLAIEKLTKEHKNRQNQLEAEVTETRAAKIELDKTEQEFRNLHKERTNLLNQLDEALVAMKIRDETIQKAEENLKKVELDITEKLKIIADRKRFLETEQENNSEVEKKITTADRTLAKLRTEYGTSGQIIVTYQDELETLKNTLAKDASTLEAKKAEIQHFLSEIEVKKRRIEKNKLTLAKTKNNLEKHFQQTDDLEARAKQLDMYYKQEEQRLNRAEKELNELKSQIFKHSQELFKLRQEGQNYLSEINGATAADKNLQAKIHRLDAESLKQQELVYNQEYQLQQLERKISRAQGERTNEEKQILTLKIKELTSDLERQTEQHNLLAQQQKKILEDVRVANRKLESFKNDKELLLTKINKLNLENENALRALKAVMKRKEELLVQENFVRLDVKRLRDLLYMRADEVLGLENRKHQLKLSMEERKQEIMVHKNVLRAELRTAEEERHLRAKDLAERLIKIDKLKRKYQLILLQISPEGEDEEHSQAYYIIRAAQQKEELQHEKDALEEAIRVSQREIQGLENGLQSLNLLNQKMHSQKTRGGMTAKDFEETKALQDKFESISGIHQQKVFKAKALEAEVASLDMSLQKIQNENNTIGTKISNLETKNVQISKELIDHDQKLQRARAHLQKLVKNWKLKKKLSDGETTFIEDDLQLQQLKQENTLALYFLSQFASNNPTMYSKVEDMMAQFGLQLPSQPPSRGSTAQSSRSRSVVNSQPSTPTLQQTRTLSPKPVPLSFQSGISTPKEERSQSRISSKHSSQPTSRSSSRPTSASRLPKIAPKTVPSPTPSSPSSSLKSSSIKFPPASSPKLSTPPRSASLSSLKRPVN